MGRLIDNSYAGSLAIRQMAFDGGGWVCSAWYAANGHGYAYDDTDQAWHRDSVSAKWERLIRVGDNTADGDYDNDPGDYVSGLAFCAGTPSVSYIKANQNLLKVVGYGKATGSVTKLTGWTRRALFTGPSRQCPGTVAADPVDSNRAAFGTQVGLYVTTNGTSVAVNSSVPVPNLATYPNARMTVAYDPSSVSGGHATRWAVHSPGNGVYESTTGPEGTFSLMTGSPTNVGKLEYAADGDLFAFSDNMGGYGAGGLRRFNRTAGTWSGQLNSSIISGCCDPTNANRIWGINPNQVILTLDKGATFTTSGDGSSNNPFIRVADDVPYLAATNERSMSVGDLTYDAVRGKLIFAEGIGIWSAPAPTTALTPSVRTVFTSETVGQAQLCVDDMKVVHGPGTPSDGDVLIACQDRGFFVRPRAEADVQPNGNGPSYAGALWHGSTIDFAAAHPEYRVGAGLPASGQFNAYQTVWESLSRGLPGTWTPLPVPLDHGFSGTVAAGGISRLLYAPMIPDVAYDAGGNDTKRCQFYKNGAWSYADIAGGRTLGPMAFGYTARIQRVCHDPFEEGRYLGTFQGSGLGDSDDLATHGVWDIKDDGTPAVRTRTTYFDTIGNYFNMHLKPNPLRQNHFGYSYGQIGNYGDAAPATNRLWLTSDRFVNSKIVPGFVEVYDFDYGAAGVGEPYERIFLRGYREDTGILGVYVLWNIQNVDATGNAITYQWARIGTQRFPLGHPQSWMNVAADKSMFGRFYGGADGAGCYVGDYTSKLRLHAS